MRTFLVSSLVLIPLLCSCATSKSRLDYVAERLGAPPIAEVDKCLDRIESSVAPRYPGSAIRSHTEGWAIVNAELSSEGEIISLRAESDNPTGVFSQAALDSVLKTRFNKATGSRTCRLLFAFTLNP